MGIESPRGRWRRFCAMNGCSFHIRVGESTIVVVRTGRGPHMNGRSLFRRGIWLGAAALAIVGVGLTQASTASAASVLTGPIDLGTAGTYGVLGASTVTNTGSSVVTGDLGVAPGSAITHFAGAPNGEIIGTVNSANAEAAKAQLDSLTAFNAAAGLTPTTSGLAELNGLSLSPGVYSGGALQLANNGSLTLAGNSTAIWVFQAASSLTIGSATHILITGGANACNVFWEIGSSASIGTSAHFQGTVMARQSITAATGATVQGRLLAANGAVTLQSNTITAPLGCAPGSAPATTSGPALTSGSPTRAVVGTPYSFTLTASGTPAASFVLSSGVLPAGLVLDSTTGIISGTPLRTGTSRFAITISNETPGDVVANLSITASGPVLAETGVDSSGSLTVGFSLLLAGATTMLVVLVRRRRRI